MKHKYPSKVVITPPKGAKPVLTNWKPSPAFIQGVMNVLQVDEKHAQLAVQQMGETAKRMGYDMSKIPEKQLMTQIILTQSRMNKQNQVNTPQQGQTNG